MSVRAPLALFAVLLILAAPLAMADHVYSHRLAIHARLVDVEGRPLEGLPMQVSWEGEHSGTCAPNNEAATDAWPAQERAVSNAHGEASACFHAHAIAAGAPSVSLRVLDPAGETVILATTIPVDPNFRVMFPTIVVPNAAGRDDMRGTHLVTGRAWAPWVPGEKLDGPAVNGVALRHAPVAITIDTGSDLLRATTTTNGYGDYAVRIPVDTSLRSATVKVVIQNESFQAPVDWKTGRTIVLAQMPPEAEFTLVTWQDEGGNLSWREVHSQMPNPDLRVLPGAHVRLTVVNADGAAHNIKVGDFPASAFLNEKNARLTYTFTAPQEGELTYLSEPDADIMKGRVLVVDAPIPTPPTPIDPNAGEAPAPTGGPQATPKTPGLGLVALLGGIAVVALMRRR